MHRIICGGFLSDRRTYVMSAVGVLSAVASYVVGDADIFAMLQAIFTVGGIYFLHKPIDKKGIRNGKSSGKISE